LGKLLMQILPLTEQAAWLASHLLPGEPYQRDGENLAFFLQFYAPKELRGIQSFTEALLDYAGTRREVMMTVMDTECTRDYEERLFDTLRFPSGERKSIFDAPAHLFAAGELPDLIPMFSLTVAWQWETYLHMPRTRTILLNWEGEIFDLWTDDQAVLTGVSEMLSTFGLTKTQDAQPSGRDEPPPATAFARPS
jgi:hypothetical protein